MSFCSLIKGITPKFHRLCFCLNKQRSFEPYLCLDLGVIMLFSGTLCPSHECAAAETRTAFRCDVTLICLAVSMATVSLVAGVWQSNGTNVQVRVLNETTGPQLEIVQISPTAGDYRCVCLSLSLAFRLSLTLAVCISSSLKYFSFTAIFVTF